MIFAGRCQCCASSRSGTDVQLWHTSDFGTGVRQLRPHSGRRRMTPKARCSASPHLQAATIAPAVTTPRSRRHLLPRNKGQRPTAGGRCNDWLGRFMVPPHRTSVQGTTPTKRPTRGRSGAARRPSALISGPGAIDPAVSCPLRARSACSVCSPVLLALRKEGAGKVRGVLLYCALLALLFVIGITYDNFSAGFAAKVSGGIFYCSELQSSGSNDSATVVSFSLFVMPLALRLLRLRRAVAGYEVGLFYGCAGICIIALWAASLDCAEVFYTAFALPDPLLSAAITIVPISAFLLWRLRSKQENLERLP